MSLTKDYSIESLRGLAIILVVIGHVIGSASDGGMKVADDSEWRHLYFTFEYFRMPLFTTISGWVYTLRPVSFDNFKNFNLKKVRRILYPMIFVGTSYFLLQYITPGTNDNGNLHEFWRIYVFPYTLFWYLPSLFIVFFFVGLLDAYKKLDTFKTWIFWTILAFVLLVLRDIIIPYEWPNFLSYKGAIYLFPYFMIGLGMQRFSTFFANKWFNNIIAILFFSGLLIQQLGWYGLLHFNMEGSSGLGLLIGVAGTIFLFRLKWKVRWFMYFGSFAYSIYLFHSFGSAAGRILIKNIGVTNDYIIFFFSLSVGITAPIIAEKILDRWGITRMLFLGRRYYKN